MINRLLHNADCNAMFYDVGQWQPEGGPYSARAIHRYVDMAADVGFDTFVYNPNCQVPLYPSRALRSMFDGFQRGDADFFKSAFGAPNPRAATFYEPYLDLLDAGVDLLAEIAAACRRRGMAPWLSIRMNDLHKGDDSGHPQNCHLMRDPAFRLSDRMPNPNAAPGHPKRLPGLNYEKKEVRDYMFNRDMTQPPGKEHAYLEALGDVCDMETLRQRPKYYTFSTMENDTAILPNRDPNFICRETDRLLLTAVSYGSGNQNNHSGREVRLTRQLPEYQAFDFEFAATEIREGWNDITVYYGGAEPLRKPDREPGFPPICVVSIEMLVTAGPAVVAPKPTAI